MSLGFRANKGMTPTKAEGRSIRNRLRRHNELMKKYESQGMSRTEASERALKDMHASAKGESA